MDRLPHNIPYGKKTERQIGQIDKWSEQNIDQCLWMPKPSVPDFVPSRKNLEGSYTFTLLPTKPSLKQFDPINVAVLKTFPDGF